MGPARESIDSGQPKSQAIGVSHLTHDELAVWIDDAYIVSFLGSDGFSRGYWSS